MASPLRRRRMRAVAVEQTRRVFCRFHVGRAQGAPKKTRGIIIFTKPRVLLGRFGYGRAAYHAVILRPCPLFMPVCLYLSSSYLSNFGAFVMNPNRPTRNAQQVRSIIQNMGRSIDEARSRRLGPSLPPSAGSAVPAARASSGSSNPMDMQIGSADVPTPKPTSVQPTNTPTTPTSNTPTTPPPVRSVGEMFESGAPRLKARPKKAS